MASGVVSCQGPFKFNGTTMLSESNACSATLQAISEMTVEQVLRVLWHTVVFPTAHPCVIAAVKNA